MFVCTALQIYFGFMVQILFQIPKLKQEADLPQIFMLRFLVFSTINHYDFCFFCINKQKTKQ